MGNREIAFTFPEYEVRARLIRDLRSTLFALAVADLLIYMSIKMILDLVCLNSDAVACMSYMKTCSKLSRAPLLK